MVTLTLLWPLHWVLCSWLLQLLLLDRYILVRSDTVPVFVHKLYTVSKLYVTDFIKIHLSIFT